MRISQTFKNITDQIKNEDFKKAVILLMNESPEYILITPSSSSGKYHPKDEINENGMILHINRCAVIADEIVRMYDWGDRERDILLASCVLHDIFKQGPETDKINKNGIKLPKIRHTTPYHPTYIFKRIATIAEGWPEDEVKQQLYDLAHCCLFHEGRWTIDVSREIAKIDKINDKTRELCKAMHVVDYVASRRSIADAFQYKEKTC